MPEPDAAADLDLLIRAARQAGDLAMGYFRRDPKSWDKGGGAGPVTEADLAVDALLRDHLLGARPSYGWLSEETEDNPTRLDARASFIVDPIDGTRAFIEGQDAFAHSLALALDGRVVAGVVYLPARDLLYSAVAGGPALLNGEPIRVRERADPEGAEVLMSKPVLDPANWTGGQMPGLVRAFRPSIAWRLALLAQGRFDGVLSFRPAWEWDIAAGALIAECAGAQVSDAQGRALQFNRENPQADGLWAAPPALHAAVQPHFALRMPPI